jgi:hypothetical protein
MLLTPKNWATFQHYKDRCPPWIKLHRDLLNNRDFMRLPLASKALAPMLWLLASESKDGSFDGSLDELVFRLHITPKEYEDGIKPLIDKGFFLCADGMLAPRLQTAIPETERETETETKKRQKATVVATPVGVSESVWLDFVALRKSKKAPLTNTALQGLMREAAKAKMTLEQVMSTCCERGWAAFKADWMIGQAIRVNPADIARVTVPSSNQPDPALMKIAEDRKKAAPIPDNIKQQMSRILNKQVL